MFTDEELFYVFQICLKSFFKNKLNFRNIKMLFVVICFQKSTIIKDVNSKKKSVGICREVVDVIFPRPERSMGLDNHIEIEKQMKDAQWKREKILEDLKRERTLLDMAKFNFNKKKNDFLRFLAHSSSYATQVIFLEIQVLNLGDLYNPECG